MSIEIKILSRTDLDILDHIVSGVFDHPINPRLSKEFLADPRHHLAVAMDSEIVIGMASAVHYVHPDKEPQLFINEVAVSPAYQNRGIGKELIDALLKLAKELDCTEAWVLTDRSNSPAMRLYASRGGMEAERDPVMFTFKLR
jgi:ribosomal protein S18 acetylase RimI-like enzyme